MLAALCGTGRGRPPAALRTPWAACVALAVAAGPCPGSCLTPASVFLSLHTAQHFPRRGVRQLRDNERRGHCFPCSGKASLQGGQDRPDPYTKGFPGARTEDVAFPALPLSSIFQTIQRHSLGKRVKTRAERCEQLFGLESGAHGHAPHPCPAPDHVPHCRSGLRGN